MGQKTNPIGFRLGVTKNWRSTWYAKKEMPALLKEDALLRKYLKARLENAAISDVTIERKPGKVVVTIHTGRPGVVIGKKGAEVDKLRDELAQLTGKEVGINVEEIKRPEVEAQLVADNIAAQLAQRISFRRAMKRAVQSAMRMGALGIKVKAVGFAQAYSFKYSPRPGTPAATMEGQIAPEVMVDRLQRLQAVGAERHGRATMGETRRAALEHLAELDPLRTQHLLVPQLPVE